VRHALLTDLIREVHAVSRGTYGYRRVHAELTLGRGLVIAHGTVELLMARAGLAGVTGRPRWRVPARTWSQCEMPDHRQTVGWVLDRARRDRRHEAGR
jgi:helix-turn-helix protein